MYHEDYGEHSSRELLDFIISVLVLGFAFSYNYIVHRVFILIPAVIIGVASSFVIHELAHRSVARANGVYAKYRAWYTGLILALILAIATQGRLLFAAPGAVEVYPTWYSSEVEMSIALAGPLANVIIGFICLVLSIPTYGMVHQYLRIIGGINAFIALFNSLPIPPLDGYKVFRTNVTRWITLFIPSVILWVFYWLS